MAKAKHGEGKEMMLMSGKFVKVGRRYVRDYEVKGVNILTHANGLFTFSVSGVFGVLTSDETFATEKECTERVEKLIADIGE
jgi:hypothetical protein